MGRGGNFIIAIMQPTFLPWIGYMAMIDRSETFVFLDSVQFSKRSWQQRNQVKTPHGARLISVPVLSKGKRDQLIKDVEIVSEGQVIANLCNIIKANYVRAPCFSRYQEELFHVMNSSRKLSQLNINLIKFFAKELDINTNFVVSHEIDSGAHKADLLVTICKALGAKQYLSAPGSRKYIEESQAFATAGIEVVFHEYNHPQYRQLWNGFVPYMSVIDVLFNEGERAKEIMRSGL